MSRGKRYNVFLKLFIKFSGSLECGAVVGVIFFLILFSISTKGLWLSVINIQVIMRSAAQLGIMAIGQALILISGKFDLSVGSTFGICGVSFVAMTGVMDVPFAFILALLFGAGIGFMNGFFTEKMGVPSLVTTLGSLYIFRGLVYFITQGFANAIPKTARDTALVRLLGGTFMAGWNNSIIWFILISITMSILLFFTPYGNWLFAVGNNERSALSRGISPVKVRMKAFVICGLLAGFSGIITVCDMKTGGTTLGSGMELESIASSVIGGISLLGGLGSIFGAAIGAVFLSMIRSGLIMMGAPPYWFVTFVGITLIGAVLLNIKMRKRFQKIIEKEKE